MTAANAADGEALLRGILEDPDDDAIRLVYADWMEDNGEHGRANAIRRALMKPSLPFSFWWSEIADREHAAIFGEVLPDGGDSFILGKRHDGFGAGISRGMISEITMPMAAFLKHAESLFRRHPITAVWLSDRVSELRGSYFRWFVATENHPDYDELFANPPDDQRHWLPAKIGRLLHGAASVTSEVMGDIDGAVVNRHFYYRTAKEADAALSRTCVAYGRGLAGLPPLKGIEHE